MMRRIEKLFRLCCCSVNQLKKLVMKSLFRIIRRLCKQVLRASSVYECLVFILDILAEHDIGLSPSKCCCSARVLLFVQVAIVKIIGKFTADPPLDPLYVFAKTCGGVEGSVAHIHIVRAQITHDVAVVFTQICKQVFYRNRLETITAAFDERVSDSFLLF